MPRVRDDVILKLLVNVLTFCIAIATAEELTKCPGVFKDKCWCGRARFQDRSEQYIVNCTNTGFTDTTILEHLPPHTEVLIFTGNHIPELPWNVFGTYKDLSRLRVVDMSNNDIQSVHGKSYHRAPAVERLLLNFNNISLTADGGHPRLFTGFPNLRELHLTGALAKEGATVQSGRKTLGIDQLASLKQIFETANLTYLTKLHLEQNSIATPMPRDLFCSLTSLLDLHLADNWITANSLPDLSCLPKLRFLDLGRNHLSTLSQRAMAQLDAFPQHNRSLSIDLGGNPLDCDEFCVGGFAHWLRSTKVAIRNKDFLRCAGNGLSNHRHCSELGLDSELVAARGHHAAAIILGVLLLILIAMLIVATYLNRTSLSYKLNPLVESVSRKVRYTNIDKSQEQDEEQEMNV